MRKNFNAQKYNKRMDTIFSNAMAENKKRERINPLKIAITSLSNWELKELKEFLDRELYLLDECIANGSEEK